LGGQEVLDLRPCGYDVRLHRLLGANVLHRDPADPALQREASLAAVHLRLDAADHEPRWRRAAAAAVDHAHHRAHALPDSDARSFRSLGDAGEPTARLRAYGESEGLTRALRRHRP